MLKNFHFFEKFRFWSNFRKISILVKIYEKFRCFRNISICVKFSKNSIFVKINKKIDVFENFETFRFGSNFLKISIWVKFSKKNWFWSKFSKFFDKFRFKSKFRQISILGPNFLKISIFFENFDLGQIIESVRIGSKYSTNFDFFENFEKFRF